METRLIFPLELRQEGRTLTGRFPYRSLATISDRGRTRKETFAPRAFSYAIEDPEREINVLLGHSFDRPIGSKRAGTAAFEDTDDALTFRVELPEEAAQPTYLRDFLAATNAGLVLPGVSPGFRVPPASTVPDAERLEPEQGNPGVMVRTISAAVLYEMSLVSRAAYPDTAVDVRSLHGDFPATARRRRVWL